MGGVKQLTLQHKKGHFQTISFVYSVKTHKKKFSY